MHDFTNNSEVSLVIVSCIHTIHCSEYHKFMFQAYHVTECHQRLIPPCCPFESSGLKIQLGWGDLLALHTILCSDTGYALVIIHYTSKNDIGLHTHVCVILPCARRTKWQPYIKAWCSYEAGFIVGVLRICDHVYPQPSANVFHRNDASWKLVYLSYVSNFNQMCQHQLAQAGSWSWRASQTQASWCDVTSSSCSFGKD